MQNDRGRCYRYCAIGERHNPVRRKRAADNLRFPLSGRSSPNFSPARKTLRSEPQQPGKKRQNIAVHTYRQCGGLRGVLSSTIRSSSIPEISPSISPTDIYSMNRDSRAWSRRISPDRLDVHFETFTAVSVRKSGEDREGSLTAESTLRIATDE